MTSRPRSAAHQRSRGPSRPGQQRIATAAVAVAGLFAPLCVAAVPLPELAWQSCAAPIPLGLECASSAMPMDYAQPTGATFSLALIIDSEQAERDCVDKTFGDLTSIPVSPSELAQSISARTRLNQRRQ